MAGRGRCDGGGILQLLGLIEEHTSAFEYDWRARFGLPLRAVFTGEMSFREAWSLTQALLRDPSSHIAAAVAGWPHPWSREAFILADLADLTQYGNATRKTAARLRPYPRPTDPAPTRFGKATRSQTEIRAALAARGHETPARTP